MIRECRRAVLALSIALSVAAAVPAASGAPGPDVGEPGPEHRTLDALVGDWDVRLEIPAGPGRKASGAAACEAKWVLDGRFVRLEYSSTIGGKPFTVVRYVGFDRLRGKFVEVHFESTHTDVMNSDGDLSGDGRTITCWGTHVEGTSGRPMRVRTVTRIAGVDAFDLEMTYVGADGRDEKCITLSHRRKRKEADK